MGQPPPATERFSRGFVYLACSALVFAVMGMFVKLASETLPIGEIVFVRFALAIPISLILVKRAGVSLWGNNKLGLAGRGAVFYVGLTVYYVSLKMLPLADATTLQNLTPIMTALLAWWWLGEKVGGSTMIAIVCGIAGVALIMNPRGSNLDAGGVAISMSCVVLFAISFVMVRKLSRTEHPHVIVFYCSIVPAPLALPWAAVSWVTPNATEWLLLALVAITTQITQTLLTMGFALERAARASTLSYLQVLFSMILQIIVFGHVPTIFTVMGMALIVAGAFAVARPAADDERRMNMRNLLLAVGTVAMILAIPLAMTWADKTEKAKPEPAKKEISGTTPQDVKWFTPTYYKDGRQRAQMVGDSSQGGNWVDRVKIPANSRVLAHTHPSDEVVTVIEGVWYLGTGEKTDASKLKAYPAGSFIVIPAGVPHFLATKDAVTVVQLNGTGIFRSDFLEK